MKEMPKVGVGVCVIKDGKVLLGKRKGAHGEGHWSFPGGHLEFGESLQECAEREVNEEVGIQIKNIRPKAFTNDIFEKENLHYVTLYVVAEYDSGEVVTKEPEKCEGWEWFTWGTLPQPLFKPLQNLLKQDFIPFD